MLFTAKVRMWGGEVNANRVLSRYRVVVWFIVPSNNIEVSLLLAIFWSDHLGEPITVPPIIGDVKFLPNKLLEVLVLEFLLWIKNSRSHFPAALLDSLRIQLSNQYYSCPHSRLRYPLSECKNQHAVHYLPLAKTYYCCSGEKWRLENCNCEKFIISRLYIITTSV